MSSAGRLATLMSEMEATMVQTEDALEHESAARLQADQALAELEAMYAHLEAENNDMQQRVSELECRLADEKTARSMAEKCAAAEISALSEHMDKSTQLHTAQQVICLILSIRFRVQGFRGIVRRLNLQELIMLLMCAAARCKQMASTG